MAEAFGNPDDTAGGGRNVGPKVVGNPDDSAGGGQKAEPGTAATRVVLRAVGWSWPGRHTLGGLGQRCGELIANCD